MEDGKELIAYCGLYCGDCFAHKGMIADMARDLRKELRQAKFKRFADAMSEYPYFATYKNYDAAYEVMGAMVRFRCKRGCRNGGGPPTCKMRSCCRKKGIDGCWECADFETCKKLDFLKDTHLDAHIKNLRILSKKGVEAFINGKRNW